MKVKWYSAILVLIAIGYGCGEGPDPCDFADVQKGMIPSEVRAVLGEPNRVFVGRLTLTEGIMTWDYSCDRQGFTVRFEDGIATSVTFE
jgi:hypothetical protein